ncbi:hypothetical protein MARTH_orf097 [Metamycoplasma arthritidis 158L3-1]|uniref:Septation ring formation regulator n=2 Tax=Metamycoplasma arthritidis TaxID=2111 RepID=B3PLZ1_META1|nr:hypothetical protein MARTH_orf097 [Metamycoplasma arthritidis 158L3-1]
MLLVIVVILTFTAIFVYFGKIFFSATREKSKKMIEKIQSWEESLEKIMDQFESFAKNSKQAMELENQLTAKVSAFEVSAKQLRISTNKINGIINGHLKKHYLCLKCYKKVKKQSKLLTLEFQKLQKLFLAVVEFSEANSLILNNFFARVSNLQVVWKKLINQGKSLYKQNYLDFFESRLNALNNEIKESFDILFNMTFEAKNSEIKLQETQNLVYEYGLIISRAIKYFIFVNETLPNKIRILLQNKERQKNVISYAFLNLEKLINLPKILERIKEVRDEIINGNLLETETKIRNELLSINKIIISWNNKLTIETKCAYLLNLNEQKIIEIKNHFVKQTTWLLHELKKTNYRYNKQSKITIVEIENFMNQELKTFDYYNNKEKWLKQNISYTDIVDEIKSLIVKIKQYCHFELDLINEINEYQLSKDFLSENSHLMQSKIYEILAKCADNKIVMDEAEKKATKNIDIEFENFQNMLLDSQNSLLTLSNQFDSLLDKYIDVIAMFEIKINTFELAKKIIKYLAAEVSSSEDVKNIYLKTMGLYNEGKYDEILKITHSFVVGN